MRTPHSLSFVHGFADRNNTAAIRLSDDIIRHFIAGASHTMESFTMIDPKRDDDNEPLLANALLPPISLQPDLQWFLPLS